MLNIDFRSLDQYELLLLLERGKTKDIKLSTLDYIMTIKDEDMFLKIACNEKMIPEISNKIYNLYKIIGGCAWKTLSTHGATKEIKDDARSRIVDLSKYID